MPDVRTAMGLRWPIPPRKLWLQRLVARTRSQLLREHGGPQRHRIDEPKLLACTSLITVCLMFAAAFLQPWSVLPDFRTSADLVAVILQAHAGFAAIAFVIVVLLMEALQRSDYAELIWDEFVRRSGLQRFTVLVFCSIAAEAVFLLVMSEKPSASPLLAAPGTANLVLFAYAGILGTVAASLWLFWGAFVMLRASFASELVTASAKRTIADNVRREVERRLGRNLFDHWCSEHQVTIDKSPPKGWTPVTAAVAGHISDICLGGLADLRSGGVDIQVAVHPGQRVAGPAAVIGWIGSARPRDAKRFRRSFRIGE